MRKRVDVLEWNHTVYRGSARLEPNLVCSKPASTMDMDCLEHDTRYTLVYQLEQAERFGVSPVGIVQALRRLGVRYKKTLKLSKGEFRKKICFLQKA
ncbi:IS630 transposase-related protein [Holospora curviuscula]|uniref:Transposase Synechocystis PCC 6803 domain-containing protein n=1 Tax=Holospora curviuscula TaxID=1082868 RepID=A0A2S5RAW4_9PROT|nr:IS630 transposase-related protein [Holospora curviuscula]PPE04265.1 hypothetical protein HCUR_00456 [Holospora curviuscula]